MSSVNSALEVSTSRVASRITEFVRTRRSGSGSAFWVRVLTVVLVTALIVYPAAMLVRGAFLETNPGAESLFGFGNFRDFAASPQLRAAVFNSLVLSGISTLLGVMLALSLAYLAIRTDSWLRSLITPAMIITFATPPLFYAIGYSLMANGQSGLINTLASSLFGARVTIFDIESWAGIILVATLRSVAFVYLFVAGPIANLSRIYEDASYTSGAGIVATSIKVNIGVLMPAITGAAILAFLTGLQMFDSAIIIAYPAGIDVIATAIFDQVMFEIPARYGVASVLSLVLFGIVVVLVVIQAKLVGKGSFTTIEGKAAGNDRRRLGRFRYVTGAFVAAYLAISIVLPMTSLVVAAFQPFPGVVGALTLTHFHRALNYSGVWDAVRNSALLALGVGAAAMFLSLFVAMLSRRAAPWLKNYLRFAVLLPKAMPGVVVAVAFTWAYVAMPGLKQLYGTVWIMFLALLVVVTPFTMQVAYSAVAQLSGDLEEASAVAGANRARTLISIVIPLIVPSFLYGCLIAGVVVIGTLDIPLMLAPPDIQTLAAVIYSMREGGMIGAAAALLVMLLAFTILVACIGLAIRKKFDSNRELKRKVRP